MSMHHDDAKKEHRPLLAAMLTGGLASACCIGPLLVVFMGLGSASAFIAMEPYRPLLALITLALIGWAGSKSLSGSGLPTKEACHALAPWRGGCAVAYFTCASALSDCIKRSCN